MTLIKKRYKGKVKNDGFTLVELLLVMAIIGILAGVIAIGMRKDREVAKVTSGLQTANSIVAELAHCYLNGKSISSPSSGNPICSGGDNWPDIATATHGACNYDGYNGSNNTLTVNCNPASGGGDVITCNVEQGRCTVTYH